MTPIRREEKLSMSYRILLGDIAHKRFRLLRSRLLFRGLSVCLSVCLSRSCIVIKRQKISTRFLLHTTATSSKIWLTLINPFLPKFCPKVIHPCWFERWRHSIANCGRVVIDSTMVTMESLYSRPPSLFRMVPSLIPYDRPFSKMDVQNAPATELWYFSPNYFGPWFYFFRLYFLNSQTHTQLTTSNKAWRWMHSKRVLMVMFLRGHFVWRQFLHFRS